MSSVNEPNEHVSLVYLLHLWQETATSSWRASLRAAGNAPRVPFADLEALASYLLAVPEHRGGLSGTAEGGDATPIAVDKRGSEKQGEAGE